eukprot:SAG31_NODE_136_length_23089_cov_8.825924_16_plen_43_part_00
MIRYFWPDHAQEAFANGSANSTLVGIGHSVCHKILNDVEVKL